MYPLWPGKWAIPPHRVASARHFHLDHFGAQTGQVHAQKRSGQKYGHSQYAKIV
jgi:hypothetical protein